MTEARDMFRVRPVAGDRPLPHNRDAERAIIGAVLTGGSRTFGEAAEELTAADLYDPANAVIFGACAQLQEQEREIDLLSVTNALQAAGKLEQCGGSAYLMACMTDCVTTATIGTACRIVREAAMRRATIRTMTDLCDRAYDTTEGIAETAATAERQLVDILARDGSHQSYVSPRDRITEVLHDLEQWRKPDNERDQVPFRTGIETIDRLVPEILPGEVFVIAARPGVGKTALMLSIIRNTIEASPQGVFSLEMRAKQLVLRLICQYAYNLSLRRLRHRDMPLSPRVWEEIATVARRVRELPLCIDDSTFTIAGIRSRARKMRDREKIRALWIDYLQLIVGNRESKNQTRENIVSDITRQVHHMAAQLEIPVFLLCQLNRQSAEGKPKMHHLRESGAIEQDADIVGLLCRDENEAELNITKQRNGPTGIAPLVWAPERMTYVGRSPIADEDIPDDLWRV